MIRHRCFVQPLLLAFALGSPTFAAPTTAPASDEKVETVTRVYDISDLLWRKTDYPAPDQRLSAVNKSGGGGDSQSGLFGAMGSAAFTRQGLADDVTKLLTDTIDTQSWKANGGNIGAMREMSGQLIVMQTAATHQKIQEVLQALRADRGRMVVVRAYWLLLEPESVPSIATSPNGKELPVVDDKLLDAKHLYCAAQTMCFSGQTVHVTSGRTRSIVTDLTPVVANDAVGYDPQLERARSGVVLQLTPHLEPEGPDARIALDLQSEVTELGDIKGEKIDLPSTRPIDPGNSIDRVNEINQQLRTTVRLPLSKKVLVGGMTLEPASKDDAVRQLYLVIEADAVK